MSLVVAESTPEGPRIVSDTRVFHPGQRHSYKTGTLKTVVVRRDLTLCFSGQVEGGLEAIRGSAANVYAGGSIKDSISTLRNRSEALPVEFLVAAEGQDGLTRIRAGEVEDGLETTWIGDQAAFERFQRARFSLDESQLEAALMAGLPPGPRAMMRLQKAMAAVIDDPAVESVDDFCVSVATGRDGFEYLASVFIHVGRDIQVQPGDDLINKMAQSVEEGGFAVSVVEPAETGTPALGLSFPRARLGMMFLPLRYDEAQVIRGVSPNHYARTIKERFGVAMKDPTLRHE